MESPVWIYLILAASAAVAIVALVLQLWSRHRNPLQNRALLGYLQQQSAAFWLTDADGKQLWHNNETRFPPQNTHLASQLYFSADGQHPGLPDVMAMLQICPHWQGLVWIGDQSRQAFQLQVSIIPGYPNTYLLWRWRPLQPELDQMQSQINACLDPVSGLPAEALWRYWLQQQLTRHQVRYHNFALVLLDIPELLSIRRNFGSAAADSLLQQLVRNVQTEIPPDAFFARLGPQQLAILLSLAGHDEQSQQQALQLTREILSYCQGPFVLPAAEVRLDCHAGIAVFPDAGPNIDELMAHAAQALQIATTVPDKLHLWQMQNQSSVAGIQLQAELQQALTQYQLEIWSQPVIELSSGVAHAVRLELYWRSPTRGLLSYASLKPLAEQTGQLLALERWAFCQTCQLLGLWHRLGELPPVQVELSASNFRHSGLLTFLQSQIQDHQLQTSQFILCLTEEGWLQDPAGFNAQAEALTAAGFGLMISQVGYGVGALQLLQQPYWQAAELSDAVIRQLEDSDTQRNACASLIRLLIHQGLRVSVQGVDTEMQAYLLHVMGCYSSRGLHFSKMRPVSGQQLPYGLQQQWQQAS
jgi:diguanylate cyclase (GGDEF)-like protein